jgi:hypothetical protein
MATKNEIVTILAERVGRQFDLAFKRELGVMVDYWRSTIMRQKLRERPQDRSFFKDGFVLELEKALVTECAEIGLDCTILRTVKTIPRPVRSNNIVFDYIGTDDFINPWGVIQTWYYKFKKSSKFTGANTVWMYKNNRIYVLNAGPLLKYIGVEGVFEDPRSVEEVKLCSETGGCASDDIDFNTPGDITQAIIQSILSTELRSMVNSERAEIPVTPTQK